MDSLLLILFLLFLILSANNKPPIDALEQKALYRVLNSLNPTIPWSTDFSNDLCHSPPPPLVVVCGSFPSHHQQQQPPLSHIVELNFGSYVSDQKPTPSCSFNATLDPFLFTSFTYLRKLSFHKCFNNTEKPTHLFSLPSFPSSLQQLIFTDNPTLISPLHVQTPFLTNLTSLKKLVFAGNGCYGKLLPDMGHFPELEELNLSRNYHSGAVPASLGIMKKLKILDLGHNKFEGCIPEQIGNITSLSKLDLSFNGFGCKILESFIHLKILEFLDLSFNRFGNFGIPLFLGEMSTLKEVYLSGNSLSGEIPEIWENLGGVEKIGFSKMGLIGKILVSTGVYLKNLSYLGLDNNNLDGPVPEGFGLLKFVDEINLENNNLSCRTTFLYKVAEKFKLGGNVGLCLGKKYRYSKNEGSSLCQLNPCEIPMPTDYHSHWMMMLLLLWYNWFYCIFVPYYTNRN